MSFQDMWNRVKNAIQNITQPKISVLELIKDYSEETDKVTRLIVYTLFAYADGRLSSAEMNHLNELRWADELLMEETERVREFQQKMKCECSRWRRRSKIQEAMDTLLVGVDSETSQVDKAQMIWTLLNLGYADGKYSKREREIVNHLIVKWDMNDELATELKDTAEALVALVNQGSWAKKKQKWNHKWIPRRWRSYVESEAVVQEVDRMVDILYKNVKTSILEADI
jgi:tellurite resistance protein